MSNLRFATRLLSRNPGSALAIIVLLALGIGASTVIFSAFDALLLRPLPVSHPEQLVRMVQNIPKMGISPEFLPYDYYLALRDRSRTFESVFAETPANYRFPMTDPEPAEQISVRAVTPEYFGALGVKALYGRVLMPADETDEPGAPPAVLSYGFWERRFNGDPHAIGRLMTLRGNQFVIVGVLPLGVNGISADTAPDVRVPNRVYPLLTGYPSVHRAIELAGRLKPGITRQQAEAECLVMWKAVMESYYRDVLEYTPRRVATMLGYSMELEPLERGASILRGRFADTLKLLMALTGVLLLIVCSNVAGLLIARSAGRRQEMAVRLAVGATRTGLICQMLAESSLLAILGAIGGLWVAFLSIPLASRALPPIRDFSNALLPVSLDIRLNGRVFLFSLAVSALTMLLFSVAPGIAIFRSSLDHVLRGARSSTSLRGRQTLIALQIALCTFLLAGASLFVRTFRALHDVAPGFEPNHVATFTADLSLAHKDALFPQLLLQRVKQIPGVASAALSTEGVMRGNGLPNTVAPAGQRTTSADFGNSILNEVSPGYFNTMGMHLLAGRDLVAGDDPGDKHVAPTKVVANEAFAVRFFPGVNPIGLRFGTGREIVVGPDYEIVGLVSDAKYRSLREPVYPTFYQVKTTPYFVLNVRTRLRPESILQPVQKALAALDPSLAFLEVHTLAEEVDAIASPERTTAALASLFGGIAALLAGVGIYGLLAYAVAQRRREIGIRMALGARPIDVARWTARQILGMAAFGIAAGLGATMAAGPLVRSLLYGIAPWDPESLAVAVMFVAIVAAAATAMPALRAAHIEPASALQQDQ
jgi:putative ABC transport system permease protein